MRAFWGGILWSEIEMNPYLVLYEDSPIIVKLLKTFSCLVVVEIPFFQHVIVVSILGRREACHATKNATCAGSPKLKRLLDGAPVLPCVMHLPIREMEMCSSL